MRRGAVLPLLVGALGLIAPPLWSATIHVPGDAPTIQEGITAASAGDTVLVACGTYLEHGIQMRSGIALMGETGDPHCVIVDAQQLGRVMICSYVTDALVSGIMLRHGRKVGTPPWSEDGGGVECLGCSMEFRDVIFYANESDFGGGAYVSGGTTSFKNVEFWSNGARRSGGALYCGWGGELVGCSIYENTAYEDGGGIYCRRGSPLLRGCDIAYNNATRGGGGFVGDSYPPPAEAAFIISSFYCNQADFGGGLYLQYSSCTVDSCSFVCSSGYATRGAAIYCESDASTISGVTIRLCLAGGAVFCTGSRGPHLANVTMWLGVDAAIRTEEHAAPLVEDAIIAHFDCGIHAVSAESAPTVRCTDVFGCGTNYSGAIPDQTGMNGNISEDPLFCDNELTINASSPCAPQNNSCGVLMGACPIGCGGTQVEYRSWSSIKALFR